MIYYPKVYGTCNGSSTAINTALKAKEENKNSRVFIYKEILHNPYVISYLESKDIYCINDLSILTKDDILIIRAHGETKETFEYLDEHNIKYYDATCINVKKVHDLVTTKYNEGYKIIIVGKRVHPEVIATDSLCNNESTVIENEEDFINIDPKCKYYLICQTTTSEEKLNKVLDYLNKNNINYIYDNTICLHQKSIQISSSELAKKMDMMIVIGGKNSSNTKELFNECSKYTKSYYFSELKEFYNFIRNTKITSNMSIGFTGGASTPKIQIEEYSNLLEFYLYYKEKVTTLSHKLDKFNKTIVSKENEIVSYSIDELIRMNKDGKFIRGFLIDLGYKLHKDDDYADDLAVAYETFETSILIHDDIIDNSSLRRNKQTIHSKYKDNFKDFNVKEENTSSSLALCIGDLGFFLTNNLIIKSYQKDKNFTKLFKYYNDIVINTIKGEIIDVYLPFSEQYNKNNILHEEDILEIYRLKTSWYTIVGPFCLGMILSNSKDIEIHKFERILEHLGIAFQIKDDILGIYSNTSTIGKPNVSDIEEFKQTILYSYIKLNKPEYYKELMKYYGKKGISDIESQEVQKIISESGSLEYANNKMNELFKLTKEEIEKLNIKENIKHILLGFISYLELREK